MTSVLETPPEPDNRLPFDFMPKPMRPRTKESDRAFCAFLLFCMQAERSIRRIGKAMGISDGTIRYWRKRFSWDRRRVSGGERAEWEALRAYRKLMDLAPGLAATAALRVALDVVLDATGFAHLRHAVAAQRRGLPAGPAEHDVDVMSKAGTATAQEHAGGQPSPTPSPAASPPPDGAVPEMQVTPFRSPLSDEELEGMDPAAHYQHLRQYTLSKHLRPEDVNRQILLIDGILGTLARKVKSGKVEVKVSDLPALLKARALLTGLPTEQVAVRVQSDVRHEVVMESTRLSNARTRGDSATLKAMRDEVNELNVILAAVPDIIDVESK